MKTEVIEVSDELGIRLPDAIVEAFRLAADDEVNVVYNETTGLLEMWFEQPDRTHEDE